MKKYKNEILLGIVLVIAFINYVVGFNWGLTSIFQPDEGKLVDPVEYMVEKRTLFHGYWSYPTEASSKVLALILMVVDHFNHLEPISYYFACRVFNAFLGTGVVLVTWFILRRIKSETFALVSALVMAIFPIWTNYSKQVTGDIPALLFSLLVLLMSQHFLNNTDKKRYLCLMSFFAACATLEKWHGAWTCFFIAFVVLISSKKNVLTFIKNGFIALGAYIAGIVILAPNILVDFEGVVSGITFTYVYDGTLENPLISSYPAHFITHLGILSVIAIITGIIVAFFMGEKSKLLEIYPTLPRNYT